MEHHPEVQKIIERHPQPPDMLLASLGNSQLSTVDEKLVALIVRQREQLDAQAADIRALCNRVTQLEIDEALSPKA